MMVSTYLSVDTIMDQLSVNAPSVPTKVKRRRHTPAFRAKIVARSQQPGASVAAIALEHNLNANLVHKWRRLAEQKTSSPVSSSEFLPVPFEAIPTSKATVHFQLNELSIDWPLTEIDRAIPWLKALGV